MKRPKILCLLFVLFSVAGASAAHAQVTDIATDGSVGTAMPTTLTPVANVVTISESLGERKANSLVHSFDRFDLGAGDTARFTAFAPVDNVISRVTGLQSGLSRSEINGTIQAGTNLTSADFYFLNPAGFFFGPGATLDLGGSFHASSATQLRMLDQLSRSVFAFGNQSGVTFADPTAFGFLGSELGTIEVAGSQLVLPEDHSLSLVAGDVTVREGSMGESPRLASVFGRINLATRNTAGEVVLSNNANGKGIVENSLDGTGTITLENADLDVSQGGGSTFGASIFMGAENISISDSTLNAFQGAGLVRLAAADTLLFTDSSVDFGSQAGGEASDVSLAGATVDITGSNISGSFNVAGFANLEITAVDFLLDDSTLRSFGNDAGGSGDITVTSTRTRLTGTSVISASNVQANNGGDVSLIATESFFSDGDVAISASAGGNGSFPVAGGFVFIEAGSVEMHGGSVSTSAGVAVGAAAQAGNITIAATTGDATFDGGIAIDASISRGQTGGSIDISADSGSVTLTDATVRAAVEEVGDAGNIEISAEIIEMDRTTLQSADENGGQGLGSISLTATERITARESSFDISAPGGSPDVGGVLDIRAPRIRILDQSEILASQADAILTLAADDSLKIVDSEITMTSVAGAGAGSELRLSGPEVEIRRTNVNGTANTDQSSSIFIQNTGDLVIDDSTLSLSSNDGSPGDFIIDAETVLLEGDTTLSTDAIFAGTGGDIQITASKRFRSLGSGVVIESVAGGPGFFSVSGGLIEITAPDVEIAGGRVSASVFSDGGGSSGNIVIEATDGDVVLSSGAVVEATAIGGDTGGLVDIRADDTVRIEGSKTRVSTNTSDSASGFFAHAGDLRIRASKLRMKGGLLESSTEGQGNAGAILVDVARAELSGDARIESTSTSPAGGGGPATLGAAGSIFIGLAGGDFITRDVEIRDATLSTFAEMGPAALPREGSITIRASDSVLIGEGGVLTSSVGAGLGGDINISSPKVLALAPTSKILAETQTGTGGAINLAAAQLVLAPGATVSADAGVGSDGEISIEAPEVSVPNATLAALQADFLNASALLRPTCAAQAEADQGSQFTVAARRGLPSTPEGFLLAFDSLGESRDFDASGKVAFAEVMEGALAFRGGRLEQAESHLRAASELLEENEDPSAKAAALRGVAQTEQAQGAYQASVVTLNDALRLAERADDRAGMAAALGSLGNAALALGRTDEAEDFFSRGLELAQNLGDQSLAAGLLTNLGNHQVALKKHAAALESYEEGAALAREIGDSLNELKALSNAARVALALDRLEYSSGVLDVAEQRRVDLPNVHQALYVLIHLAKTNQELASASPKRARKHLLRAHQLLQEARGKARNFADSRATSYALGNLGALYQSENRGEEALYLTRMARDSAEQANAADALYRWHWQEGKLLWSQGRAAAAIAAYQRAVEVLEETRQETLARYGEAELNFRRTIVPVYLDLVDALLQSSAKVDVERSQPLLLAARATLERFKAAEMRDYFRDDCSADLAARSTALELVAKDAAVIYPVVLDDRLELLVSTHERTSRHTVPVAREQLAEQVARLRQATQIHTSTSAHRAPARKLYQWLVAPYAKRLAEEKITTLVFAPDGPLRSIPMAVLMDGTTYLSDRFALATTQSLSLVDPQPLEERGRRVLLAGVSESVQGFGALPNVGRELEAVEQRYGGTLLLNEDFTVDRISDAMQSIRPSLVHIASHAVFTGDPETSFVLAHGERLNMERLSGLVGSSKFGDEPLELLVLSACETAAGDERAALGLAGVAIRAGARSVLGSLWSISDEAAYEIVVHFYEALDLDGVTKAEALRRAQASVRADPRFEHPYYWSPFLMINNWL